MGFRLHREVHRLRAELPLGHVVRAAGKQSRTKVHCRLCVLWRCQRNGAGICLLVLKSKAEAYQLGMKQEPVTRTEYMVTVGLSTMLAY